MLYCFLSGTLNSKGPTYFFIIGVLTLPAEAGQYYKEYSCNYTLCFRSGFDLMKHRLIVTRLILVSRQSVSQAVFRCSATTSIFVFEAGSLTNCVTGCQQISLLIKRNLEENVKELIHISENNKKVVKQMESCI